MPLIELVEGADRVVCFEAVGPLIDACDEARSPVEFGCRTASCGTCRVAVHQGAELLEPASVDEIEMLARLGSPPEHRLACQAVVRRAPGIVRLVRIGPPCRPAT